jgi:predicted acyl esterase
MVRNYLALAGPNTYLIDGPWTHGSTFDDTVWFGAMLAWFDRWLYGDTAAPLPPTHVASYQMPAGPWHTLADWSASSSTAETLSLASTGKLSATPGAPGTASYVVNPAAGAVDLPAADHLTFTGAPLTSTRAIRGAGSVQLDAMLTDPAHRLDGRRADTNFVLHLYDVDTSGSKTLITRGYLKASHYRSQSDPEAIPLGSSIRYTIPLWHIDYRVGAGHHVELVLQAGEKDCCQSSAPAAAQPVLPVTVSVATGSGGSTLRVPWTDSAVG